MPITRADETELLTALHEGAFEQPLWMTFLTRLRARTRADYVIFVLRRGDAALAEAMELYAANGPPPGFEDRRTANFYRSDPALYSQLRPGRVYSLSEFLDTSRGIDDSYRREFLAKVGFNFGRIVRIAGRSGANAWLAIVRGKEDFSGSESALLGVLAPHLEITLHNLTTIETERLRTRIAQDAVDRLAFGWITLDGRGNLVDCNARAEQFLQRGTALRRAPSGQLRAVSPQADRALGDAIRSFTANPEAQPVAIPLADGPRVDMIALPICERTLSGKAAPVLIAYLHESGDGSGAGVDAQIVALFGLSRTEARLAVALCEGKSIAEAAIALNLTLETARNYSKRVYAKTGARGQADLVRLILTSPVVLARHP